MIKIDTTFSIFWYYIYNLILEWKGLIMKLKLFFLLITSIIFLYGCSEESAENEEATGEGMGTLSAESEEGNETEGSPEESSENEDLNDEDTQETKNDNGLLDLSNTESGWINFEGVLGGSSEYRTSQPVEYNPEQDYELSPGAYISYFNGDEFIQTMLYNEPTTIEQVPEADNIRVSYHNSFESKLALNEQ